MTIAKQVQPPRLRLRYRVLQSSACLALLLGFVAWASAFAKRLEEAEQQGRERTYMIQERVQDVEREVRDLIDVHTKVVHRWRSTSSVLPPECVVD